MGLCLHQDGYTVYQHKFICEEGTITLIDKIEFSPEKETISTEITGFEEANDELSQGVAYNAIKGVRVSTDADKVLYFINYARMYLNCEDDDNYMAMAFGYLFIYIVLIVFTGMFAIRYVKRVIYLAFLTLMAPMVALTYPLDKIKDRKSTSI